MKPVVDYKKPVTLLVYDIGYIELNIYVLDILSYDNVSIVKGTAEAENDTPNFMNGCRDMTAPQQKPTAVNEDKDVPEPTEFVGSTFRRIRKTLSFPEDRQPGADRRRGGGAGSRLTRPILQRRNSLFSAFQALSDGFGVAAIASALAIGQFGAISREYVALCVTLLLISGIVYDRLGIYRNHRPISRKAVLLFKAWTTAFGILLGIGFLLKVSDYFSRQYLVMLYVMGYGMQVLVHFVGYRLALHIRTSGEEKTALVIGSGQLARYLHDKINSNPWIPERIVGLIRADEEYADFLTSRIPDSNDSEIPVLGGIDDVLRLVDDHGIRVVYIAVPLDSSPIIEKLYLRLIDRNIDVHWTPNIFGMNLVNYRVKELSGLPIITLSESPMMGINLVLKAMEDRVLATLGLVMISPVLLVVAIAIKLDSPGPVFFRQERTGWDGQNFRIWKFRTMRVHDPEEGFVRQATRDDPRITRLGRFLRRTSIDELPQLFNVIGGSMSLVGPRPHAVSHNISYSERIEAYLARHRIKPGITGLAQVRGYRGETRNLTEMIKRVESDLEYINNWSIWLDIKILVRTVAKIFFDDKAY